MEEKEKDDHLVEACVAEQAGLAGSDEGWGITEGFIAAHDQTNVTPVPMKRRERKNRSLSALHMSAFDLALEYPGRRVGITRISEGFEATTFPSGQRNQFF